MAGAGWRTFTAGAVLTAAQVQTYLQDQTVQVHASAAARSSALGTAVSAGMVSYRADGTALEFYNGSAWQSPIPSTLSSITLANPVFSGAALESAYQGSAFAGYTFYAVTNGAVQTTFSGNATANGALNITSTAGQTLNTLMVIGQSLTVSLALQNGATPYYPTSITIDGSSPTVLRWSGGTAPTSGNANSWDVYTATIIKTGSGTFNVLASQTKFA